MVRTKNNDEIVKSYHAGNTLVYAVIGKPSTFLSRNVRHFLHDSEQRLDTRRQLAANPDALKPIKASYEAAKSARDFKNWYPVDREQTVLCVQATRYFQVSTGTVNISGEDEIGMEIVFDGTITCEISHAKDPSISCKQSVSCKLSKISNRKEFKVIAERIDIDVKNVFDALPSTGADDDFRLTLSLHLTKGDTAWRDIGRILDAVPETFEDWAKTQQDRQQDVKHTFSLTNDFSMDEYHIKGDRAPFQRTCEITKRKIGVNICWKGQDSILTTSLYSGKSASRVKPRCEYELIYVFAGINEPDDGLVVRDLCCQFCRHGKVVFDNLARLMLHYSNDHAHFRLEIEKTLERVELVCATISIHLQETTTLDESKTWNWLQPRWAFDSTKALNKEYDWAKSPSKDTQSNLVGTTIEHLKNPKKRRAISPSKVPEMPTRKKKSKVKVPDIDGLQLYRSLSKRLVEPGEYLSDSEEEQDSRNEWAREKRRLQGHAISGVSRGEFWYFFDTYIRSENLCGDKYLPHAIVRFCRKYRERLAAPSLRYDLEMKLKQLELTELLPGEYVKYCQDLVGSTVSDDLAHELIKVANHRLDAGYKSSILDKVDHVAGVRDSAYKSFMKSPSAPLAMEYISRGFKADQFHPLTRHPKYGVG